MQPVARTIQSELFDWESRSLHVERRANDSLFKDRLDTGAVENLLSIFLATPRYSSRRNYEAAAYGAICPSQILEQVHHGTVIFPTELAVWIDDRCRDMKPRSYNGPMSIKKFHEVLQLKLFNQKGEPDAAIRRIHIPNPDSLTVAVLILATSPLLAPVLRFFLWSHFEAHRAINVNIMSNKPIFTMEFHISFPVWARVNRETMNKDSRKRCDGTRLRKMVDLSFLSQHEDSEDPGDEVEVLYQAQSSGAVFAYSKWAWSAYSLLDIPQHPLNEKSLEHYVKPPDADNYSEADIASIDINQTSTDSDDGNGNEDYEDLGFLFDPLTIGNIMADNLHLDPRAYFLSMFKEHAQDALEHTYETFYELRIKVDKYLEAPHVSSLRRKPGFGHAQGQADSIEKSEKWTTQTSDVIALLISSTTKDIDAYNSFAIRDAHHFNDEKAPQLKYLFTEVSDIYERRRRILIDFEHMQKRCKDFQSQLSRTVMVEENRVFVLQHWTVTIFHFSFPPTLASSVMQSGVFNFKPSVVCFLTLTIVFGGILFAIAPILSWHTRRKHTLAGGQSRPRASIFPLGQQTERSQVYEMNQA